MPLTRQSVAIPVVGSADERSDPKQVRAPKLLELVNVDLSETGAIKKRRPYAQALTGQQSIPVGGQYGPTPGLQCRSRKRTIKADTHASHYSQHIVHSSLGRVYAAAVSDNPLFVNDEWRVVELDPDTLEQINDYDDETPLSTPTGTPVHLLARDDGVVAIWIDGSNLRIARYSEGGGWTSPSNLATNVHATDKVIAVCQEDESTGYVVYSTTAPNTTVLAIDLSLLTASAHGTATATIDRSAYAIAYFAASDTVWIAGQGSLQGVKIYEPVGTTTVTIDGSATARVYNLALGVGPGSGTNAGLVVYDHASVLNHPWLYLRGFNPATGGLGATHEAMGQFLDSTIIDHKGSPMFVVRHSPEPAVASPPPASRFLVACGLNAGSGLRLEPVAAMSYAVARRLDEPSHLCPLVSDGADRLFWSGRNYQDYRTFTGVSGGSATQTDASVYVFDFAISRNYLHAQAQGLTMFAGGVTLFHDGSGVDAGPLLAPTIDDVTTSNGTGSLDSLTAYNWIAVYEMTDKRGRTLVSPPSLPFQKSTGGSENTADIDVFLPISRDTAFRYVTRVVLYRNNPAVNSNYHRVTAYVTATALSNAVDWNQNSSDLETVTDGVSEASAAQNELLYAQPGSPVLEDYPAPPSAAIATHRRRVFVVHSETGDVWGSKLFVDGEPVRFTLGLSVFNPTQNDIPTALVSAESSLIVFYASRIGHIYGDGPDDLGQGGQWSEIEFLPSNTVGAISQACTCATPHGVFFVDQRQGAMLMPYGGAPSRIGNDWPIGSYDDTVVRGVDWLEDRDEVRFTFADGTYRSYHVALQAWSTGTLYVSSGEVELTAVWGQSHVYMDSAGLVLEESTTLTYGLPAVPVMAIRTGWIPLAKMPGVQGRFRLWDMYAIGEYVSTHGLRVTLAYDYDESDSYTVDYADSTLSTLSPYQVRVSPSKQQVQAVQVYITEWLTGEGGPQQGATTAGPKLSQLRLDFGIHPRGGRPFTRQGAQA